MPVRFELDWELDGEAILLAIDTPLSDQALLSISVDRSYYEVGSDEEYGRYYFNDRGNVGEWRQPRRVVLDAEAWKSDLTAHQAEISRISKTLAFEIDHIDNNINLWALGAVPQDGQAACSPEFPCETYSTEQTIHFPLRGTPPPSRSSSVAWDNLVRGETYRLLGEPTTVMSHNNWSDDGTLSRVSAGRIIRVIEVDTSDTEPWYKVVIVDDGRDGWINSIALMREGVTRIED